MKKLNLGDILDRPIHNYFITSTTLLALYLGLAIGVANTSTFAMLIAHCLGFALAFGVIAITLFVAKARYSVSFPAGAFSTLFKALLFFMIMTFLFAYFSYQALRPPVDLSKFSRYNDLSHVFTIFFFIAYGLFPMRLVQRIREANDAENTKNAKQSASSSHS